MNRYTAQHYNLICWFASQETFIIIINIENSYAAFLKLFIFYIYCIFLLEVQMHLYKQLLFQI